MSKGILKKSFKSQNLVYISSFTISILILILFEMKFDSFKPQVALVHRNLVHPQHHRWVDFRQPELDRKKTRIY